MAMKNPPHPGKHVRVDCLEPFNLTVTKAAKILGVTRPTLSNLLNGKAGISAEMAFRLTKAFGGTPESWLRLQLAWDISQVRKREKQIKVKAYKGEISEKEAA